MRAILILTTLCLGATAPAQFIDPKEKIKEIINEVADEMQAIDKMLLQSTSQGAKSAAEGMKRSSEKIEKLLDETRSSQSGVVKSIDKLLEEIQKMAGQSGSCPFGSNPKSGGKPKEGEDQKGRRKETPKPDMARKQRQQGESKPEGGKDREDVGRNKPSSKRPNDPTEHVAPNPDAEGWGDLPKYLEFLKNRGGSPQVPEKYRKFHEAYLKQSQKNTRQKSGK